MAIQIIAIETSMGSLTFDSRKKLTHYLNEDELKELDLIGYSRKTSDGKETSRDVYLNSLGKGEFTVRQTRFDNGDFSEAFMIGIYTKS